MIDDQLILIFKCRELKKCGIHKHSYRQAFQKKKKNVFFFSLSAIIQGFLLLQLVFTYSALLNLHVLDNICFKSIANFLSYSLV